MSKDIFIPKGRKEGRKDAAKKAHGKKQYGTSVYNVIVVSQ